MASDLVTMTTQSLDRNIVHMFVPKPEVDISCQDLLQNTEDIYRASFLRRKFNPVLPGFVDRTLNLIKLKKPWFQKYVVLSRGCLYVYRNEKSNTPGLAISLYGYNMVTRAGDTLEEKFAFKLIHANQGDQKTHYFAAPSEMELKKWMKAFQDQMKFANGKSRTYKRQASSWSAGDDVLPLGADSDGADLLYDDIETPIYSTREALNLPPIKGIEGKEEEVEEVDSDDSDEGMYLQPMNDPIPPPPSFAPPSMPTKPPRPNQHKKTPLPQLPPDVTPHPSPRRAVSPPDIIPSTKAPPPPKSRPPLQSPHGRAPLPTPGQSDTSRAPPSPPKRTSDTAADSTNNTTDFRQRLNMFEEVGVCADTPRLMNQHMGLGRPPQAGAMPAIPTSNSNTAPHRNRPMPPPKPKVHPMANQHTATSFTPQAPPTHQAPPPRQAPDLPAARPQPPIPTRPPPVPKSLHRDLPTPPPSPSQTQTSHEEDVLTRAWWDGTKSSAKRLLLDIGEEGVYMIRESASVQGGMVQNKQNAYNVKRVLVCLCRFNGKLDVKFYVIQNPDNGLYSISERYQFGSICELLDFYSHDALPNTSSFLKRPYKGDT